MLQPIRVLAQKIAAVTDWGLLNSLCATAELALMWAMSKSRAMVLAERFSVDADHSGDVGLGYAVAGQRLFAARPAPRRLDPGLAENRVAKGLSPLVRPLSRLEDAGDCRP